ncbi:DUF5810 domain-containing protein [Natrinema halophilum]|uniref:Uncharacterized protein n=1 Tax=Natrinema halophilum TaxID=1699371 RepID=A0A7D5GTT1_9EURY|nr:DUF5810 domain-containing protein [Natrinema halophilum]QLG49526.1 DUF5810 domain-containing protein [Natrinema halophilum]
MGYACPVCDAEEADARHLANHLAITASLGRENHRAWLEEHAPDWSDCNPEELGEIVTQHAAEIDTPEFEEGGHAHGHGAGHSHDPGRPGSLEDGLARQSRQPGRGSMTGETESVLREAAEMTRKMQSSSESDADDAMPDADADANESDTEERDADTDESDASKNENA